MVRICFSWGAKHFVARVKPVSHGKTFQVFSNLLVKLILPELLSGMPMSVNEVDMKCHFRHETWSVIQFYFFFLIFLHTELSCATDNWKYKAMIYIPFL